MIPVLFARSDSIYKTFPQCDVYDVERNALTYSGKHPVIAHPPCRLWGRLRQFSTASQSEKELALYAVRIIRQNGGVLEHPAASTLWDAMKMPKPGDGYDEYGGFTICVSQFWWGHKAEKRTWLYICGLNNKLPQIPFVMGYPQYLVTQIRKGKKGRRKPVITKAEREHTPPEFAMWLIDIIKKIHNADRE